MQLCCLTCINRRRCVEIRPLFSQTCTARIQKFPDGSGSPQMFLDVSKCVQKFLEPESHRGPTLKHRPQHRAEDTESLERLRQQISITLTESLSSSISLPLGSK
eukprot:jgi/Chrzof1/9605/Cz04g09130.t1